MKVSFQINEGFSLAEKGGKGQGDERKANCRKSGIFHEKRIYYRQENFLCDKLKAN